MQRPNNDAIQYTINFWSQRTGAQISSEDAREMVGNIAGFFEVLQEWDERVSQIKGAASLCDTQGSRQNRTKGVPATEPGQ